MISEKSVEVDPQDARQGGSFLPPAIVRRRERRAASRLTAAPTGRRAGGGVGAGLRPPLARTGDCDCQRRPAIAERGARTRERSKATNINAVNQQVTE